VAARSIESRPEARLATLGRWPRALADARRALLVLRPYMATALFALRPVAVPGSRCLHVDRWWRLYYDPALLRDAAGEVAGLLYHVVWHLLRDHARRREESDVSDWAWALASDLEINGSVSREGAVEVTTGRGRTVVWGEVLVPSWMRALRPSACGLPEGKAAEAYAAALERMRRDGSGPHARAIGNAAAPWREGSGASTDPVGGDADGRFATAFVHPIGGCGSGAGAAPKPWELGPPRRAVPGVGVVEGAALRRETARAVQRAARWAGDVPGSLRRWASDVLQPRVSWRRVLVRAMRGALDRAAGAWDYSYRRPGRRAAARPDVILPSLVRPDGPVAVVVDTSGSMSATDLGQALAELRGVIRASGRAVTVIACDAAVQGVAAVTRAEAVPLRGGGGTDMGAALATAARLRPRPVLVVVLTDGHTPWPQDRPAGLDRVMVVLLSGAPPEVTGAIPRWVWRTVVIEAGGARECA